MHRLPNLQLSDIDGNDIWQIRGSRANLDLKEHVFEHAAAGLHPFGLANRFERNRSRNLLIRRNFLEIDMQHLPTERVMLNIANERETLALSPTERQVHQKNFRVGGVDHVFEILRSDFEILRLIMATVNNSGNAAIRAHLFNTGALAQFAWKRAQRYRFHLFLIHLPADFAAGIKKITGSPP